MKKFFITAIGLILISLSPISLADSCSCSAPDGSCEASVDCKGGCISFCGVDGDCMALCSQQEDLSSQTGHSSDVLLTLKVTGDAKRIGSALSMATGKKIVFRSNKEGTKYDFNFRELRLWDILEQLARSGKVTIEGIDFERLRKLRRIMQNGEKLSLCLRDTSIKNVSWYLSFVSGLSFSFESGNPSTRVSSSFRNATLKEIIGQISSQTGVRISVKSA